MKSAGDWLARLGLLLALLTMPMGGWAATAANSTAPDAPAAFLLVVEAPAPLDAFLLRHLELQRFRTLPDLSDAELDRLLATAPDDIRRLLATQGHFRPDVQVQRDSPPEVAAQAPRHTVRITVQPGPLTHIADVQLTLLGDVTLNPAASEQRAQLQRQWGLPTGEVFTQTAWDDAKRQALRQLSSVRFPQARLLESTADIDPDTHQAHLRVTLDSGPAFAFGDIEVKGTQRYGADTVRHLVRLAGVLPGAPYDEALLHAAQQRLTDSGYFESAFVLLNTEADPTRAPVQVRVREARLQKVVVGLGASTDNGARISLEHTHHRLPWLGWQAVSNLQLERETRTLGTELASPVDAQGWRRITGAQWQRQEDAALRVTHSQQLRLGRSQDTETRHRGLFLQYDRARTHDPALLTQEDWASSLSVNYAWSQRRFDHPIFPTQGHGLAVEVGAGMTLSQEHRPYLRTQARWQSLWPLAAASDRPSRLSMRLEGGAIWSQSDTPVPATQRFLAGGDNSVRGYTLREIGVPLASGGVEAGRWLGVASLEWQRPLWFDGQRSPWEASLFVDAGAVANHARDLDPKVGVGAGVRYNSPVGPLQMDLAYGLDSKQVRLHMRVGFTF